jgi:hypothetical protein
MRTAQTIRSRADDHAWLRWSPSTCTNQVQVSRRSQTQHHRPRRYAFATGSVTVRCQDCRKSLLSPIITEIQRVARAKCRPEWYQDSVCWQGTCLGEDHYSVYGDHVEELWQKIYIKKQYGKTWEKEVEGKPDAEKAGMVQDWIRSDPRIFSDMDGYTLHVDARFR